METKDIKKIAEGLINSSNKEVAYFKFDEHESGEYFIKANKDGFLLYASILLKAAIAEKEDSIIGINDGNKWLDNSMIVIDYAQLIKEGRQDIIEEKDKSKLKDTLVSYGCYFGILLFIVSGIIGLLSVVKHLIDLV